MTDIINQFLLDNSNLVHDSPKVFNSKGQSQTSRVQQETLNMTPDIGISHSERIIEIVEPEICESFGSSE